MERCSSCAYYDRNRAGGGDTKAGNAGQCRRSAPALSPINQKTYMIEGVWPTIRDDDWCGEWKALQRRLDVNKLTDVLNTPLSTPLPGTAAPLPRPPLQPVRPPAVTATGEPRRATIASMPLAPLSMGASGVTTSADD
ncbi:MAG TPA: hypothetical protein VNE58_13770 [Casimicrobiaceae bacterium]|nr:hypothetical protein [Casimicrobiaceae bacterium]